MYSSDDLGCELSEMHTGYGTISTTCLLKPSGPKLGEDRNFGIGPLFQHEALFNVCESGKQGPAACLVRKSD